MSYYDPFGAPSFGTSSMPGIGSSGLPGAPYESPSPSRGFSLSALGSSALSSGLGFLGNLGGSIFGGLFSANQAKKNRAFQERMYNKQVEDSIKFWNMQNEYNLPSAVRQRIEDAGINPYMYFSNGSIQSVANSSPDLPSAPHGAQGSPSSFNTAIDFANLRLVEAQTHDLEATARLKEEQTAETSTHVDWYEVSKELDLAIKRRDYEKIAYEINSLATSTNMLADMTWKNLEYLSTSMEIMQKKYDLSERETNERIAYWLNDIAVRNRQVDATLKGIAVSLYKAVTERKLAISTIAKQAAEIKEITARTDLTKQQRQTELQKSMNQFLHNVGYMITGSENINGTAAAILLMTGSVSGRADDITNSEYFQLLDLLNENN